MRVTSQYLVDAPGSWVREFLLIGTTDDNVTVDGDVVEVRQHDRLMELVVRNTVTTAEEGGTLLNVDAHLRLRGFAGLVGLLFHRRVRRTLVRSLDGLPRAIESALDTGAATAYTPGIVEPPDHPPGGDPMTEPRDQAEAATAAESSQDPELEADKRVPEGARENLAKAANEASAGDGIVDAVKRVGREVDRTFGGEYEAREDQAAAENAEETARGGDR